MRKIVALVFVFSSLYNFGQIDYSKLLVGRNVGTKTMHDGVVTNIFGFAETLSAAIDVPGPTLYINEGDSIEIDFWNVSQGAPHTIHLHGLDVNQQNDGVPSLSYEVHHMDHGYYKFKAPHAGTYMYHCHVVSTIHVQAGMYGVIVVRPPGGDPNTAWDGGETFGRDFVWTASEIDTNWHTDAVLDHPYDTAMPMPVPVPADYVPQYFMVNGMSGTQLTNTANYAVAGENEKVYLRLVNAGYYGVRYIFPSAIGARSISSDGRPLPTEVVNDTVVLFPGERYGVMLQLGSDPLYPIAVEHINMNTQVVESSQTYGIKTSAVGLDENEIAHSFTVYPVPSTDGVFYSDQPFEGEYVVYNAFGQELLRSSNQMIDLSNHSAGFYYLHYQGEIQKLIIR